MPRMVRLNQRFDALMVISEDPDESISANDISIFLNKEIFPMAITDVKSFIEILEFFPFFPFSAHDKGIKYYK